MEAQQLAGKATMPDSVLNRYQIDKYNTGLLLSLERIVNALGQQNNWSTVDFRIETQSALQGVVDQLGSTRA